MTDLSAGLAYRESLAASHRAHRPFPHNALAPKMANRRRRLVLTPFFKPCGHGAYHMCLMDDTGRNPIAEKACTYCGVPTDTGLIFCTKWGAALQTPAPLIKSGIQDENAKFSPMSPLRRTVVLFVKGLAAIAAVVFLFCPLSTGTQVILFVASIAVLLICHFVLTEVDENYIDEHMKDGYWPTKPIDWNTSPKTHDLADESSAQTKP
jgi:hypothetical protein